VTQWVLDASAVIADLRQERGAELVRAAYGRALISAVNQAEVLSFYTERGLPIADARKLLTALPVVVEAFEGQQMVEVARLRPLTKSLGLSLADRACLALASLRSARVLTTDRSWTKLSLGIDIRAIR
jgi:PIN domain nuclease of toxin-antitoxin system